MYWPRSIHNRGFMMAFVLPAVALGVLISETIRRGFHWQQWALGGVAAVVSWFVWLFIATLVQRHLDRTLGPRRRRRVSA